MLAGAWIRLRALVFRQRANNDLDEEMRYHLDREIERNVANGMTPSEARGAARRAFGNLTVATEQGVAIPAFSSSLSYYDGYRRERGPANLIQGLRDFFGAHTYQRTDAEGYWHTRWSQDGTEVAAGGQPRSEASGSTSLPAGTDAPASEPDTGPKAE